MPDDGRALVPAPPRPRPNGPTRSGFDEQGPESRPWEDHDFSPLVEADVGDYVADGGATYRKTKDGRIRVCGFVAVPLGERVTLEDLDDPTAETSRTVTMRITTPSGDAAIVNVPLGKGRSLSDAIIAAVPSGVAQLSVQHRQEVAAAAASFTSPDYFTETVFGQTGWLLDGRFGFPGSDEVSLDRLGNEPGLSLLRVPTVGDPTLLAEGAYVLLDICKCAPLSVVGVVLGTIMAAPMFRRSVHLGARAFLTMLVGGSGSGKTLLLSRLYCLLGAFFQQPSCITAWHTTYATLEAYVHGLRDIAVLLDDYRASDGNARETFRHLAIALGDGTGKGRSSYSSSGPRVVGGSRINALVVATGEHGFEDDAAVNGRMLEVVAQDVDCAALLNISTERLRTLPNLFSAFVHYLATQTDESWRRRRDWMQELAAGLTKRADARTSENLATVVVGLGSFTEFVTQAVPQTAALWTDLVTAFGKELNRIAEAQARRVHEDRLDQVVLREIARAVRQRTVRLEPLGPRRQPPAEDGAPAQPSPAGLLLGAYDSDHIYVMPDVTTRWASRQVQASGRRRVAIGRKELGWALEARGGGDGVRAQITFDRRRNGVWPVRRSGLGPDWEGLLDELVPRRQRTAASPRPNTGEP